MNATQTPATDEKKPEMVFDPMSHISGRPVASFAFESVFEAVKESPIAQEHPEIGQAVWDAYKRAVDNFEYDRAQGDNGSARNLIWACGQVYGAAKVLAGFLEASPQQYIPHRVQEIARRYGV